jgi:N-acetylglutamate synthase/N-acetylornithine aminotransferase
MKIREVGFYSEGAMTLTYTGEGGYCFLDVFNVRGHDFEDACKWAAKQIVNDELLAWAKPFVRGRLIELGLLAAVKLP